MRRSFLKLCRMHLHTLIKVRQHQRMNRIDQHCLTKLRFLITRTSDSVSSSANANAATKNRMDGTSNIDMSFVPFSNSPISARFSPPAVPSTAQKHSTFTSTGRRSMVTRCTSSSSGLRPVTNSRNTNSTSAMHVSTIARWSTPVICVFCISHSALMGAACASVKRTSSNVFSGYGWNLLNFQPSSAASSSV